jgi:anti-sigma regulatory factor (Ser/Thr protein kinase)
VERTQLRDCTLQLAAQPSALRWARRHTTATLCQWSYPPDVIETVKLIVSELATNAVTHARPAIGADQGTSSRAPATGLFGLRLRALDDGTIRIEVQDNNPDAPVHHQAADDDESGRGLELVRRLSRTWGYSYTSSAGFKTVWCEVAE